MSSVLINTTPQQKHLYAVKRHEAKVFTMPFHMHERFELTYIVKGKGTRIVGDNIQDYCDGDIVLIAPYTPHQWQSGWIGERGVSAVTLFFSEQFPTDDFRKLSEYNAITRLLDTAKYGIELKGELKKSIALKMQKLSDDYGLLQILDIIRILNEIAISENYNILMDQGFYVPKNREWARITNIVDFIRLNLSEKITIKEIADIAFMHEGSVNRFFKQATGFTLVEYINLMRIGKACELLSGTQMKTYEIAFACGFNNLSNFNRIFKKVKKLTPNAYRIQF